MEANVIGQCTISRAPESRKGVWPVGIHVARASLALGIVRGNYGGRLEELLGCIRSEWFESVKGLKIDDRTMTTLDVDEPLLHLSKDGCVKRDSEI